MTPTYLDLKFKDLDPDFTVFSSVLLFMPVTVDEP